MIHFFKTDSLCKCLMTNMYQATYDFIASKNTPVLSKFSFRLILDLEHFTLWDQVGFSCKMIFNQICMVDVHYKMANNRQKSFLFCYIFINCRPLNTKKMCILQTNNLFVMQIQHDIGLHLRYLMYLRLLVILFDF